MSMQVFIVMELYCKKFFFFFSSRRRHTSYWRDWSSDVCSSDLITSCQNWLLSLFLLVQSYEKVFRFLR